MSGLRVRVAAAGAVLALTLAACSGGGGGSHTPSDVANQGYVSSDGSTTTWATGHRKGPLDLAGKDYADKDQDVTGWRGDVVVVNTWYANCPPCRAEAPDLVDLANDYAGKGVHVVGLNATDAAGEAEAFQRKFDVPYPSIHDTSGAAVASLQGVVPVNAVPTTIVLDRDGHVAARLLGLADASTLRTIVDGLLAEKA
ncbi:TlpA disulfide reductase family protein [Cellulomonas sp. HZM]|uniref:TlpA family protein disulfide reductase n=1 Tax=Cellulomonas sp. HZM TaxID=1454010 RepID=UPI0004936C75|nr:TlpA disulfide reductase family protein [Cellulomonas sp. HZM]